MDDGQYFWNSPMYTVLKVILQFWNAIAIHLSPKYLNLPRTVDEMPNTGAKFKTKF